MNNRVFWLVEIVSKNFKHLYEETMRMYGLIVSLEKKDPLMLSLGQK